MNQQFRSWTFWLILIPVAIIFFSRCANIVPPGGGPRDTLPPVLLQARPADSTLHFKGQKIQFSFDEYVELDNINDKLIVSPTLKRQPIATAKLRTVTITFKDTLKPNTTYTFNFADGVRDINERNPIPDFQYVVSTGDYLDSLQIMGRIINAENGTLDSSVSVLLYQGDSPDSIVSKEKPLYYAKSKSDGTFRFKNLAPGTYKIFAIKEEDKDLMYSAESELIAFIEKPITITEQNISDVNMLLFLETDSTIKKVDPMDSLNVPEPVEETEKEREERKKKLPKLAATAKLEGNKQELPLPLRIDFNQPLRMLDSNRIQLFQDSTREQVAYHSALDSTNTSWVLHYPWKENMTYQLIIPKDAVRDTSNQALLKPDTINFVTKKLVEYSIFKADLVVSDSTRDAIADTAMHFVVQLVQDKAIKYSGTTVNGKWTQELITPGEYTVRVLLDANNNGKWDRGSYFTDPKRQPERVILLPEKYNLKAGWNNIKTLKI
ncbi:Ig-like domain-containing protein [Chitinophaga sp. sic0106]|uniref:Ig-like domain-containing protein n=1 Tax=Chitinophaga sp. sic0106 TaxID=2854785 RepID=UPI001C45A1B5|nr:Ig-like domain-containing protein [Chitinophaga sp. sic0106]MBV7528838.1 Ig-like domain-containing protein [Chitinophaga sp. sic0106]